MKHSTESIYELFCCKLKPFIISWVKNDAIADDIHQEVFLKIHENISKLKNHTKVKAWVMQITRNTIIDYLQNKNFYSEETEVNPSEPAHLYKEANERDLEREITQGLIPLINTLPEKYAEAILLVELEGLSQVQLSKKLNISISGAKSRVQRGRQMIKNTLLNCCHYEFDKYGTVIGLLSDDCCCCNKKS